MKIQTDLLATSCLIASIWLLAGCAGYNNTLFMTKSNVGLDFDSKPPTLEVSIARKEAVIAPSFEGGKTPPVLASFKPHAGSGSAFASFAFGVDQTFAGGDAAKAMAMLYNLPTATNPCLYDSSLELSEKPPYENCFQKIPGKGATRPFIFGTDTSFGFKAAWSGTGGQIPDTVRLGFNRKEFAWAPISATPVLRPDGSEDCHKVNVKMPAFLATIESSQNISGDGSTRVQGLQYFATGQAATYLAMQQDVRKAMLARLDPNQQKFASLQEAEARRTARSVARLAYDGLKSLNSDNQAQALVKRLDEFAKNMVPAKYPFTRYSLVGNDLEPQPRKSKGDDVMGTEPFARLITYWDDLERNHDALTKAKSLTSLTLNNQPVTIDAVLKESGEAEARLKQFEQSISSNSAISEALGYYVNIITK